ncbi:MAG: CDP-alcohol phosphatidyltransferase family protein [Candidatus Peregrinibacteria bacterium]|nr:CDP-alcohol phosphatidyltransferase family protein [Candidatus Peregrinibacteria bacterium]
MLIPIGIFLSPPLLLVGYALHFTFDALDGALARSAQRVTARGAYLDVTADYLALVVTVIAARWAFGLSAFWTLLYTVCYILVIVHFLSRNAQGKHPPFPLLRTRFPLFLLVALCVFRVVEPPWLDLFLAAASIYYAAVLLVCLLILRWKLR